MLDETPSGWKNIELGDVCEIARGGSPRPIDKFVTDDPNGINWIKIGDASASSKYIYSTKERIRPEGAAKSRFVSEGHFLLSNSMSFGRPYIMKTSGCIHDGWLVLSDKTGEFDPEYFYYLLSSPFVFQQFSDNAAGSAVKNLNIGIVSKVRVFLPPLPEQERIAEVLSSVDDSIRATEAVIAQAERVKRGLMEDLLTGGLGSEAIARGEVPEGWLMKQIGDLANVRGGKRMPKGAPFSEVPTPYPYIRVSDLKSGSISKADLKYVSAEHQRQISRYTISKDDLYISIAGTLGIVGLVPDDLDGAQLTENAAKLVLKNPSLVNKGYLVRVLQSDVGQSQIHIKKGVGGGVPKLALFRIAEINVPVPPEEEQIRIAKVGGAVDAMLTDNRQTVDQLLRVKRGLMDDLLTGRVRTV